MAELKAESVYKQKVRFQERFQERFRIEDAFIPNIRASRKALLMAYGEEDASDVHVGLRIKGFGPKLKSSLWDWRRAIERQFVFDPRENIDPADVRVVDAELSKIKVKLSHALSSGSQRLQQILQNGQATRSTALQNVNRCSRALAQAQVDTEALR